MPPKRKAQSEGRVGGRKTSKVSTPMESEDDFTESGNSSSVGDAGVAESRNAFSCDNASRKQAHRSRQVQDSVSALFRHGEKDFSYLSLKPDHDNRPLWVDPLKFHVVLESFSPLAGPAKDFLTTVAEPMSRPTHLHEFRITANSLYAAVSVGLDPRAIVATLNRLSKVPISDEMAEWIMSTARSYGKVKLVLKHNRYFIESTDSGMLQLLREDPVIGAKRIAGTEGRTTAPTMGTLVIPGTKNAAGARQATGNDASENHDREKTEAQRQEDLDIYEALREDDDEDDTEDQLHHFEVPRDAVEEIQKRCQTIKIPLVQEYDFRNDEINPGLYIDLKPSAQIRPYQEKSLSKMFGNGRARSGMIVLPCGAGKTLVGITAACTIRKGIIILCTSAMSVVQWRQQFLQWSNIEARDIAIFTADHKQPFERDTGIVVSTYSMVTQTRGRSYDSQKMMDFLTSREWGLMILDEVHVVPANIFRKVATSVASHCKLGLTATLLREDDKIKDLNFLIGPKLYEANWMELADQGHIAKVQCAEVWCPMTTEFYTEYLDQTPRKRALLYIMNPRKFQACQFLIDYHEKRGDKVIVFSDNVYALQAYAKKLQKAFIFGGTAQAERLRILENFQHNDQINTIFLSKIGDTSLDLPEATCLIQISSHYGSRRQEAQRLGRILRAKRRNDEGFNAFFYSLVSKDTSEMYYSSKRQAFLVDQGYAFKVITHLQGIEALPGLAYASAAERRELLQEVMLQNETAADLEKIDGDMFSARSGRLGGAGANGHGLGKSGGKNGAGGPVVRRQAGMLSELSGGQDMAYIEYNKSRNKELKREKVRPGQGNAFVRSLQRDRKKTREAWQEMYSGEKAGK